VSSKLYEAQSHLMLTGHIMNPEVIVMNNRVWKKLTDEQRAAFEKAALEVREKATRMVVEQEASQLDELKKLGMTVIGPEDGLDLDAFKKNAADLVAQRFAAKYGDLYKQIEAIK
jgi:TRAP-type C4-dicarboxylate transport system substrate-binding protein